MGGAFTDCNQLFCQLSGYSKQELCGLTIFNLTARQDLQSAFDLISQIISPPMDSREEDIRSKAIVLRGAMKNQSDFGLSISLIKGDDNIAQCCCVTLIKNPVSPYIASKPIAVSFDSISAMHNGVKNSNDVGSTPAFTSG
jgi:hypothetical protein